jgi:hypothetical protein
MLKLKTYPLALFGGEVYLLFGEIGGIHKKFVKLVETLSVFLQNAS